MKSWKKLLFNELFKMLNIKFTSVFCDKNNSVRIKFFRFIIAGGLVILIDTLLYYFLAVFFKVHYLVANSIAFFVSMTTEYYISREWVFNNLRHRIVKDYLLFFLASLTCLIISNLILFIFIDRKVMLILLSSIRYENNILLSKMAAILITTLLDFWLKKNIVFKSG